MVARPGQYQASLNSGELAPNVWGRSDIKQFYSGASLMQNAEPVPQGGFDGLPGTRAAGRARGPLAALALSYDGLNLGPFVAAGAIAEWRFAETLVDAVDIVGLASSVALAGLLRLQSSRDGVTWQEFGPPLNVGTAARTRRIAMAPGAGALADRIRLMLVTTPPASVTFALAGKTLWREASRLPASAREFEHTYSADDAFTVVLTEGHGDIWKGDNFVASVNLPLSSAMLSAVTREQRLDAMLLFHVDSPPLRIMRRESDFDWSCDAAPFENIPLVDYGATYGNVVNDIWVITLQWSSGPAGLLLECNVNGEDSAGIGLAAGPDWTAFAADLKTALEALPSVSTGIGIAIAPTANYADITVEFSGPSNAGSRFSLVPKITNVTWASATASHRQLGDPGGENIMSATRGWPAAGGFYQDRLYLAGFKSQAGAVEGSVTGEYFDLNTKIENPAGGVLFRVDTSGAERVGFVVRSKHLVLFSNEAEYFISDRAIVRGTPPNVVQSSRNGIATGIAPVESENSLLYVGRSRSIIFAAAYSDVSQSYESDPISLLASHLIRGVRGTALQRASESTDAARYWIVRDDGLVVVGVMIRNQDVTAFVRFVTDGLVRNVCVDGANVPYALVERQVGAERLLLRERVTDDAMLHQETTLSLPEPQSVVTGLALLEGAQVWAFADGYAEGPLTVTGGAVTLSQPASEITIGRWTPPRVDTLPLPRLVGERMVLQRPVRVHTVRAHLLGSTSLAIGANGRPPRDVPLLRGGDVSDQPIQPYTGTVTAPGLMGWTDDGIVTFTQTRPGRFRVRNITVEARV